MRNTFPQQTTAIFVCRLDKDLFTICAALQRHYALPDFHYDEHSTWEYASAVGTNVGFNITKTDRLDTNRQWMPNVADDVNYQIIFYANGADTVHKNRNISEKVHSQLTDIFQATVRRVDLLQQ